MPHCLAVFAERKHRTRNRSAQPLPNKTYRIAGRRVADLCSEYLVQANCLACVGSLGRNDPVREEWPRFPKCELQQGNAEAHRAQPPGEQSRRGRTLVINHALSRR